VTVEERLDRIEKAVLELADAMEWGSHYHLVEHILSVLGKEVKANAVDSETGSLSAK